MSLYENEFSRARLDKLEQSLHKQQESEGEAPFFEVLIDGKVAVPKTNDLSRFNDWETELSPPDDKEMLVRVFAGKSTNCNRYVYNFQNTKKSARGLSGLDDEGLNGIVAEKVAIALEKKDYQNLKKEFAKLEETNKKLAEENEELAAELANIEKSNGMAGLFGSVAAKGIDALISNSKLLKNTPLGGLLNLTETIPVSTVQGEQTGGTASFSPAEETHSSPLAPGMVEFALHLQNEFSEQEYPQLIQILKALSDDKHSIKVVLDLLTGNAHG